MEYPPPVNGVYNNPSLNFGAELEFSFVVKRAVLNEWRGLNEHDRDERYREKGWIVKVSEESSELSSPPLSIPGAQSSESGSSRSIPKAPASQASSEPSTISELTVDSRGTVNSDSYTIQRRLQGYATDLLNHRLANQTSTPSLLGVVKAVSPEEEDDDEFDPTLWHLTDDASVTPHRSDYAKANSLLQLDVRQNLWVVGMELVSPILKWEPKESWNDIFKQINNDLTPDDDKGAYFTEAEGLHVHLSLDQFPMTLGVLQNVLALYGLFENEIETWFNPERRENPLCTRLHLGMQVPLRPRIAGGEKPMGERYTPKRYTDLIYATTDNDELTNLMCGVRSPFTRRGKYVQVYISPGRPRPRKDLTIEFRQHTGTLNPELIKWWVLFVGYLLRFAVLSYRLNYRFVNESPTDRKVENITSSSILDWIHFPEEGKRFFANRALHFKNTAAGRLAHAKRELEAVLIQQRSLRAYRGEATGYLMDQEIMKTEPYLAWKNWSEKEYGTVIVMRDEEREEAERKAAEMAALYEDSDEEEEDQSPLAQSSTRKRTRISSDEGEDVQSRALPRRRLNPSSPTRRRGQSPSDEDEEDEDRVGPRRRLNPLSQSYSSPANSDGREIPGSPGI